MNDASCSGPVLASSPTILCVTENHFICCCEKILSLVKQKIIAAIRSTLKFLTVTILLIIVYPPLYFYQILTYLCSKILIIYDQMTAMTYSH